MFFFLKAKVVQMTDDTKVWLSFMASSLDHRFAKSMVCAFETLFGDKAGDYIGEFEVAMEQALRSDVRSDCPNRNASKLHKRWKTVASEFISASSETREKMRMSWNLKGIMNEMHLKTFAL